MQFSIMKVSVLCKVRNLVSACLQHLEPLVTKKIKNCPLSCPNSVMLVKAPTALLLISKLYMGLKKKPFFSLLDLML